jgi:hypothetical protein
MKTYYSKLINATRKGIINDNKIVKKKNPNPFERTANHNLAIAGARELGCNIVNISAEDLNQGKVRGCTLTSRLTSPLAAFAARSRVAGRQGTLRGAASAC